MKDTFPVAVVLSAYHNRLLVSFGELRGLLNYMTGTKVGLWEVPKARAACVNQLGKQFPWLEEITPPEGFKNDAMHTGKFVRSVCKQINTDTLKVAPLPPKTFVSRGPFER